MINIEKKPELLAPAGSLDVLKTAIFYGADAVYIGGNQYGLRAKAKNFSMEEIKEGIKYAHANNVKVYVTANIIAHNQDLIGLEDYFKKLEDMGADALIIADPGVLYIAKETVPNMPIHLSTQANNTNYKSALFWHKQGVERIVVARELSLKEISEIRKKTPQSLTLEAFVHGAMCISYSGRCLLSNYMTGRDANKGDCAQSCRWKYYLVEETRPGEYMPIEENERGTYIYNSKDLCMIDHIPDLIKSGIDSFKIEGRMKTSFYVGSVVKIYREAIDDYFKDSSLYETKKEYYLEEVKKISHRDYTKGFYFEKPKGSEQIYTHNTYIRGYSFAGIVKDYNPETKIATLEQRTKFSVGEEIEFIPFKDSTFKQIIDKLWDEEGNEIKSAPHPKQIVKLKVSKPVEKNTLVRKKDF
ncbi:peptidase U32 family protein [Defluviitalea phaphyphila]|uniref:peptidase U32 family protein n=1 Tax=Defluviitalea phaphyphila TaxID=1473580 RepID=UPI0007319DC0|nr:U32 family peptidase [Defluviitalea phaphyphila]